MPPAVANSEILRYGWGITPGGCVPSAQVNRFGKIYGVQDVGQTKALVLQAFERPTSADKNPCTCREGGRQQVGGHAIHFYLSLRS